MIKSDTIFCTETTISHYNTVENEHFRDRSSTEILLFRRENYVPYKQERKFEET